MISIKKYYFPYSLRNVWARIYSECKHWHSPFQSYLSNVLFFNVYYFKGKRTHYKPIFFYCSDGDNECIFPLAINDRGKQIVNLSSFGPIDYYDVIISKIDIKFIVNCLSIILQKYAKYEVFFENINEKSVLYSVFSSLNMKRDICVKIEFDTNLYEDYFLRLSKHQRQNIRTAYNKLKRESIEYAIEKYDLTKPIPSNISKKCQLMYENRCEIKNRRNMSQLVYKILELRDRLTNPLTRFISKERERTTFILYFDKEPVAYMSGFYNSLHDTFFVPRLSCNNKYLKYDAGILMLNESIKMLLKENIKVVDLTRGDEPYKYAMGGIDHFNYTLRMCSESVVCSFEKYLN